MKKENRWEKKIENRRSKSIIKHINNVNFGVARPPWLRH